MIRFIIFFIFFQIGFGCAFAADNNFVDSLAAKKNSTAKTISSPKKLPTDSVKSVVFQPNPKRAAIYSAICPGLGQLYNRRYWKMPIVYASFGTAVYFAVLNYTGYNHVRQGISRLQDADPSNDHEPILVRDFTLKKYDLTQNGATQDDLFRVKKYFRQNLDVSIIAIAVVYILNVVDANVDAHLYGYNMNDDLAITPLLNQNGIGLALQFK